MIPVRANHLKKFISGHGILVLMRKVTVFSTQNCPYCRMAKAFLEKHGVPYESIDVGRDEAAARKMIEISGQRGVPVITVDNEVIVGFDSQRLSALFAEPLSDNVFDVLIVGGGPAGLTAAVYCGRKMLKTLVVSESIGGQALESWAIENYMGYRMISGEDLMNRFYEQVTSLDIRFELDRVTSLEREDNLFVAGTVSANTIRAKTVILAQGNSPKKLGVTDEEKYMGRGLSICSTCDGPLYKGKMVAIVGGGNSALQTAIEMSEIAKSVSLIVRSSIRADQVYVERIREKSNITVHTKTRITALHGDKFITGATIETEGGAKQDLILDGIFIEIGWVPNTSMVEGFVRLNQKKEVEIDLDCHTSVPGLFAAGDVTSVRSKQIIIAAGEGAKTALEAHAYLMRVPDAPAD